MFSRPVERAALVLLCLVFLVVLIWLVSVPSHAQSQRGLEGKNILILHYSEGNAPVYLGTDKGLSNTLQSGGISSLNQFFDSLELRRNPGPEHRELLVEQMRVRYGHRKPDLIITMYPEALEFVLKDCRDVLPDVPVLALYLPQGFEVPETDHKVIGHSASPDIMGTLEIALRLVPGAKRVYVVSGAHEVERRVEDQARHISKKWEGQLEFVYLSDMPFEDILATVSNVPPSSIILALAYSQDVTGKIFMTPEVTQRLSQVSTAPIFGILDVTLGHGITGGSLINFELIGTKAGRLALDILGGTKTRDNIPAVLDVPSVPMFDWRQLRRWNLNENALPKGSIVINREFTLWDYRYYLIGILALCLAETALIIFLVVQGRRKILAEQSLGKAEEKYRDIFENALEGIFETSPQGQFLTVNSALARMLGYALPEELTSTIADTGQQVWVDPNERLRYVQLLETQDVALGFQCQFKRRDGTRFWVSLNTRRVPGPDGRTLFYSGFVEDITERKHAEETIKKSETKYRRLYQSMRDGFAIVNMDGTITEFNEAFREMTGYTRKELFTLSYRDLTPKKWHDLEAKIVEEQVLTRGYSDTYEKEYRKKDGTLFPIVLRTFLIKDEQGNNTGMWAIVRDITERKRAEEALLERLRFEELLSSIVARSVNASPAEIEGEIADALQAIVDFFQVSQCVLTKGYPEEKRAVVTHVARTTIGSSTLPGVNVVPLLPWTSETMLRGDVVRFTALGDLPAEAAADRQTYWKLGIRSILSIPLSFEGSMAYSISIASFEEERAWPEEYIPRLQLIGETLINTIERKRAAAALEERLKFETLLAYLSARFVALATNQVDRQIEDAQRRICELLGLERSTFWQVSYADSANSILLTHSYQSSGATLPRGVNARDLFPWAVQKALSGETISVSTMEDFPPEAARDRDVLHSHGVKSILILPLVAGGGTILGALTFAQVSKERDWPATVVKYLQLIAQTFANALSRKKADDALRESNERFRQVAENVGDFIWEIDAQGLYRYTSPSVKKILGYSPDELVGKLHFYDLYTPEVREELKTAAFKVFAAKQPFRAFPNPNLSKDGRVVHLETSGSPVLDEAGNLTGYIGVDSDVTERQKLEAHLQQAEKMEALGTLTGGIAHDFNNILAAIMGFTELTKEKLPEGSREERHLQMVLDASLRGRELIRQMLTFSRQTPQEMKPLLLSSIVNETSRFLRASIPATISIRVNVESESGLVLADPVQIQQVVTNLCTNAAHAMREKGGTLDIALSDFSVSPSNGDPHGIAPGLYMRLTVRDAGVGMPREIVDKIFDPFFTTKKAGEGTGLGLSVVMGIVKQSQGYITVASEPGRGSTFTVYFPKVAEKPIADAAAGEEPIPTGSERILFVDDEKPLVAMGEALLAGLGYEVTSRTSSRQALELLKQDPSRFDLVITDQTMPEITGVELARTILAIRPGLPVILCTGFSHLVDADSAKAAGIKGFVMKPLTKSEIARTVRAVLDG